MRPAWFPLFTALFLAPNAWAADDCSEVRMDIGSGSMSQVRTRDQGELDICYSVVMSQMLDAWRFSHGEASARKTSPVEPALGHILENPDEYFGRIQKNPARAFFEHGAVCKTFRYSQKAGACTRDIQFSSSSASLLDLPPEEIRAALHDPLCSDPELLSHLDRDLVPLAVQLSRTGQLEELRELLALSCPAGDRLPISQNLRCRSEFLSRRPEKLSPKTNAETIARRLSRNAPVQPVGITYCSAFLWHGSANPEKKCDDHLSLIIGRKKIRGRCRYLLRNTIGTSCNRYHREFRKDCDRQGNVWVDAELLHRKIFDLTYLEEESP